MARRRSLLGVQNMQTDVRMAFATRSYNAILSLSERAPISSLTSALKASNPIDGLLDLLRSADTIGDSMSVEVDPLAAARARGATMMRDLLKQEGGTLRCGEVSKLLGISTQGVNKRRDAKTLIGLQIGGRDYTYPVWQFGSNGALKGLSDVLHAFTVDDPWMQVNFFLTKDGRLNGRRPIDVLKEGDVESVVRAARAYGEHGAA